MRKCKIIVDVGLLREGNKNSIDNGVARRENILRAYVAYLASGSSGFLDTSSRYFAQSSVDDTVTSPAGWEMAGMAASWVGADLSALSALASSFFALRATVPEVYRGEGTRGAMGSYCAADSEPGRGL